MHRLPHIVFVHNGVQRDEPRGEAPSLHEWPADAWIPRDAHAGLTGVVAMAIAAT